jgi:hypothetical protein
MSQVAHPSTPSLGVRLRSRRLVWLAIVLVAIASTAAVLVFVPGDDSSESSVSPTFQPGVSAPHPNEGSAPIQRDSGAYTARPEEGTAPLQRGSDPNTYSERPQEGQAPIRPSR